MKETAITTRDRQRTATQPITTDPHVGSVEAELALDAGTLDFLETDTAAPAVVVANAIEPEEPDLDADEPGVSADPVRNYLNEIGRTALLDAAQEVELSKRIEAGVYAEHKLA